MGRASRDGRFLVGMLSLADALLGCTLADLVEELRLAPDLAAALLTREGPIGELLDFVIQVERGEVSKFEPSLENWGLDFESFQAIDHEAHAWVHGLIAPQSARGAS